MIINLSKFLDEAVWMKVFPYCCLCVLLFKELHACNMCACVHAARSSLNSYSEASHYSAFVSGAKKICICCYFQNLLWEKHTFLTLFPFSLGAEQYFRRIPEASGFKILISLWSLGNYVKYSCYYKYLGLVVGCFFSFLVFFGFFFHSTVYIITIFFVLYGHKKKN